MKTRNYISDNSRKSSKIYTIGFESMINVLLEKEKAEKAEVVA